MTTSCQAVSISLQDLYRRLKSKQYGKIAGAKGMTLTVLEGTIDPEDEFDMVPGPFILRMSHAPWWIVIKRVDGSVVESIPVTGTDYHVFPSRFFDLWSKGYRLVVETK